MSIVAGTPVVSNNLHQKPIKIFGRVVFIEDTTAFVRITKVKTGEGINTNKLYGININELKEVDVRKRKVRLKAKKKDKEKKETKAKAKRIEHVTVDPALVCAPTGGVILGSGRKVWFDGSIYDADTQLYFPAMKEVDYD